MTGPSGVMIQAIEVPTPFRNFEDYWSPFLGGQSPAPGFARSLPEDRRIALLELIRRTLRTAPDGSIQLTARAWGSAGNEAGGPDTARGESFYLGLAQDSLDLALSPPLPNAVTT